MLEISNVSQKGLSYCAISFGICAAKEEQTGNDIMVNFPVILFCKDERVKMRHCVVGTRTEIGIRNCLIVISSTNGNRSLAVLYLNNKKYIFLLPLHPTDI